MKIKVIGLGNPLRGDDGLGVAAIQRLAEKGHLPGGVELIDGGLCGLGLLELIDGADAVVLVDAVHTDAPSGTIIRATADQIQHAESAPGSVHDFRVGEALRLAAALGTPLPPITLIGMVPDNISPGENLSPVVEANLARLVDAIRDRVRQAATST